MTAQIAEYLRYQGEVARMCTEPLADYFAVGGRAPKFTSTSSANRREHLLERLTVAQPGLQSLLLLSGTKDLAPQLADIRTMADRP